MLDERLKTLQQLPENEQVKQRVRQSLTKPPQKRGRPLATAFAFCVVLLLLVTTNTQLMTSTGETAVYTYFDGEHGNFKARPSMLYTGIQKIDNADVTNYLAQIPSLPTTDQTELYTIVDVVFIQDQQEFHYQLGETEIYDVQRDVFYVDTSDQYTDIFFHLFEPKSPNTTFLPLLTILLLNVAASIYYKRLNIIQKNIIEKTPFFYFVLTVALFTYFIGMWYALFVGPLYKPLALVIGLPFFLYTWRYFKERVRDVRVLKFEQFRLVIVFIMIMWMIFTGF